MPYAASVSVRIDASISMWAEADISRDPFTLLPSTYIMYTFIAIYPVSLLSIWLLLWQGIVQ